MAFKANINFDRFEAALQVVDAHTVGEFCRMVIGGFPEPEGTTMIEKKKWMEENYDHVRTALMFEPRGHHDMFGAFICEPINPEAQFGVLFMDTGEYEVTPRADEAVVLETAARLMTRDVTVNKIPYFKVANESGNTIYIGSEV